MEGRKLRNLCVSLAAGVVGWGAASAWGQTPSFTLIGAYPGGSVSDCTALSADGTTAVGYSFASRYVSFRWRRDTGREDFSDILGPLYSSTATGVSTNGSILVGYGNQLPGGPNLAYKYTGSFQTLPPLPGDTRSRALGVSGDGAVAVGDSIRSSGDFPRAVRWTPAGVQNLGFAAPGDFVSRALGISTDGSTIFGYSAGSTANVREAATWTEVGGWRILSAIPSVGTGYDVTPAAINRNGSVVVGSISPATGRTRGIKWVNGTSTVLSGFGDDWVVAASGVTADGSMIVGGGTNVIAGGSEGLIWLEGSSQPLPAHQFLTSQGVSFPTNWHVSSLSFVSENGTVLVGNIQNDTFNNFAFVATIPPPASVVVGPGYLVVLRRRRRV